VKVLNTIQQLLSIAKAKKLMTEYYQEKKQRK